MDRDPYAEGNDAFLAGLSETANPYDLGDDFDDHCLWNDGWNDASEAADE